MGKGEKGGEVSKQVSNGRDIAGEGDIAQAIIRRSISIRYDMHSLVCFPMT